MRREVKARKSVITSYSIHYTKLYDWKAPELLDSVPGLVSVWHQPYGSRRGRLVQGREAFDRWRGERFPVAGLAFLQVNRAAAEPMTSYNFV